MDFFFSPLLKRICFMESLLISSNFILQCMTDALFLHTGNNYAFSSNKIQMHLEKVLQSITCNSSSTTEFKYLQIFFRIGTTQERQEFLQERSADFPYNFLEYTEPNAHIVRGKFLAFIWQFQFFNLQVYFSISWLKYGTRFSTWVTCDIANF